jgi:hypothetical protein
MAAMLTVKIVPNHDPIGLGVTRKDYGGKILYGHTGGLPGYSSWAFSIPADSVSISFALNYTHSTIDDGFDRFGPALLDEIYRQTGSGVAADRATATLALHQNYPNPFTETTTISYDLPSRSHVTIEIADALGEIVARPLDEVLERGSHTVVLNGESLEKGTYFCVLRTAGARVVRPMQIAR